MVGVLALEHQDVADDTGDDSDGRVADGAPKQWPSVGLGDDGG